MQFGFIFGSDPLDCPVINLEIARMSDRRHADPIRDRHLAKLRESGLSVDAIAERTGLAKRTILQRLAQVMKKSGTISRSGISVR